MLNLGFFNPFLLWGLPLAAIPIIIHILNRRRFQKVPWAAMEYLLRALKQNRRRIRMEQWLLLLLRVLAVMLLVFLVTRPQLTGGGLIQRTSHHVVIIDDSASMQQRSGVANLFRDAVDKVNGLAEGLAESNPGDLFSLIRATSVGKPDLAVVTVNPQLGKRVREALAGVRCTASILDLASLLSDVRKTAGEVEKANRTQYYLITDLRRVDWLTAEGKPKSSVQKLQEFDQQREHLKILEVGKPQKENLAITAVRRRERLAMSGTAITLEIEVHNMGETSTVPTELSIDLDGRVTKSLPLDALAPGEKRVVDLRHTFREDGFHGVAASLPNEAYDVDNKRALALEVLPSSQVLVVDGDPNSGIDKSETFLLAAALDPSEVEGSISGITPIVIPEHALASYDISQVNMIWLCNVPAPSAEVTKKLEDYVAAGGGLVMFFGEQVDPPRYNEVFYKAGKGLLPLALGTREGDHDNPDHVFLADRTHPAVAIAPEVMDLLFSNISLVRRYIRMAEDPTAPCRVVLRVKDADGSPLLVSRTFRQGGKVYVCGTTADADWSTLINRDTGVPLVQEIHKDAVKVHNLGAYNRGTDGEFLLEFDGGAFKRDALLRGMGEDGVERTFTAEVVKESEGGVVQAQLKVPMAELRGLGLFQVVLQPHKGPAEVRLLSRNAPLAESKLEKLSTDGFRKAYPDLGDKVQIIAATAPKGELSLAGQGEIWRVLALALLAALLLETLLAWRFGRR